MYNRYIPQSDGSFQKNRIPEAGKNQNRQPQQGKRPQPSNGKADPAPQPAVPVQNRKPNPPKHQSAGDFLRHLLPQGLDTGDLLIAVLLLLMAGDCQEDKNSALLTLALYLFM